MDCRGRFTFWLEPNSPRGKKGIRMCIEHGTRRDPCASPSNLQNSLKRSLQHSNCYPNARWSKRLTLWAQQTLTPNTCTHTRMHVRALAFSRLCRILCYACQLAYSCRRHHTCVCGWSNTGTRQTHTHTLTRVQRVYGECIHSFAIVSVFPRHQNHSFINYYKLLFELFSMGLAICEDNHMHAHAHYTCIRSPSNCTRASWWVFITTLFLFSPNNPDLSAMSRAPFSNRSPCSWHAIWTNYLIYSCHANVVNPQYV